MRRLSYADPYLLASAAILVVAIAVSAYYVASEWLRITEVYGDRYVSDEIYYVDTARRYLQEIFGVDMEYWSYSGKTSEDYFNLEHPPTGKYIIALSMIACGDTPSCWRLPGLLMALSMLVMVAAGVAILGYKIHGGLSPVHLLAAAAGVMATASDPVFIYASSVAMLDIYLAFFTALTLVLALSGRLVMASVAAGLALSVKMSGLAALMGLALSLAVIFRDKKARVSWALASAAIAGAVYSLMHVPLIIYFTPETLIYETVDAIRWHITPRPGGPPTSTPLGWVLNENPFYYSYSPLPMPAKLNTVIHLPLLVASLYIIVLEMLSSRVYWRGVSHVFYFSVILMYYMVYAAGNTTLYSFYSVQLSPIAGFFVGEAIIMGWALLGPRCGACADR